MATKKTTSKKSQTSKSKKPAAKPLQKPAAERAVQAKPTARPRDPNAPAVGTTLKRSFKGQDHTIKVTAAGYQFDGQTFGSLTAVARHITGYAISGPVFFKLVEPKAAAKAEA
ncbi:MAG: DUF2924 domain-containing protein [Betaproteobacteria bacterium]|nr:DUF2924 domain-containing protein [Betaproteobacteria bacterium]